MLALAACGGTPGDTGSDPTALPTATSAPSEPDGADGRDERDEPSEPAAACSGASATVGGSGTAVAGLTDAAAATREVLLQAAHECDWEALRAEIGDEFTFSYGASEDAITYWQDLEERGTPITAILVHLLQMDHVVEEGTEFVVWPAVMVLGEDATEEQWEQVEAIHTPEEIATYHEHGYLGWRVGITPDGEWQYFVAGD